MQTKSNTINSHNEWDKLREIIVGTAEGTMPTLTWNKPGSIPEEVREQADLLVKKDGKYILVDFKTSKSLYQDFVIQLGSYVFLVEENMDIEIDRAVIVRFPKDNDDTEIRKFTKEELAVGLKQFKLLRKAFDIDKDLNKLLKGRKK